jgi:lipid-A-disaccharide synthase
MRYYLIAGERSGDLHAGNLVRAIRKYDPEAELQGIGGDYMQDAGVTLTINYSALAFMGFIEVIKNWNAVSYYTKKSKAEILAYKPDVVVLIDYGGFNMRIARFCKKNNIRVFYYITPKVWAWYQGRAKTLKRTVDRMFVILPFEKDFFKKFDWDVDYVGNPVWDVVKAHQPDPNFLNRNQLDNQKPIIALLPGSRKQELMRMIPVMTEVAARIPGYQFAVAVIDALDRSLYGDILNLPNVKPISEDTYNLLLNATAAIVTSGTATLETALFKVPQVVIYKASATTYRLVKLMINVSFISLVNLIAGKEVIKELIQDKANATAVSEELQNLVENAQYRNKILTDYDSIIKLLDTGSASDNAARLMTQYLRN